MAGALADLQILVEDVVLLDAIWRDVLFSTGKSEDMELHNYLNGVGNGNFMHDTKHCLFSTNCCNKYCFDKRVCIYWIL